MEKKSNLSSKVFSGFFWKFSERILAQGISFIVSIILARIMLPEHYGVVAMVTVFINIANIFVTSGFSTSLIQKKDADETDFSTIFWCTLFISISIYLLLFFSASGIASFYNEPQLSIIIRVFALKIIISAYNSIQHAYVSRHMLFKKFFYSTLIGTIVSGIVGIIMALNNFGVWALVMQYLTNSIMDTIVLGFTIKWKPKFIFSKNSAKSLMSYGWKILIADLFGTIYNNLRQLLIGKFYSSSELAFYNKGKQIPELVSNNVDTTISSVLFPAMSNEYSSTERVKELTRRAISITSYIIFPLMFGLVAVAKPLIIVLLTEKWIDSVIFLQLICIAKAIATVSNANIQAMKALGRSDIVLKLEIIKKPVGIILIFLALTQNVFCIALTMPIYSIYAAIVNMKPNKKLLNYSIKEQLKDIFPTTVLSLFMMICVLLFNVIKMNNLVKLVLDIVIGGGIYIGLSWLFKFEPFKYILNFLKNFINKRLHKMDESI